MAKHRLFGKSKDTRKFVDIRREHENTPQECEICGAVVPLDELEEHKQMCDEEMTQESH